MKLPTSPQSPNLSPTAFSWLFPGAIDGIGKSSMLASIPKLLIIDPDKSTKALPTDFEPIDISNWKVAQEFLSTIKTADLSAYSGLGIDNLNIFHDHFFTEFVKKEGHPGDKNDMGKTWNKANREWMDWLRGLKNATPGLFIATCHTNIIELKVKNIPYSKYVPAIPGGGARGSYRQTMELFDIVGFMTREPKAEVKEPGIPPKDARADLTTIQTEDITIIHFLPSIYWEAKDNSRQLPHKLVLPEDWSQDWQVILNSWGKEKKNV